MSDTYNITKSRSLRGEFAWDDAGRDFVMIAIADTYDFDPDHQNLSDIVAHELSGSGNTRAPVLNRSVVQNLTDDRGEAHADDPVLENIDAGAIGYLVIFEDTGDPATSPLVNFMTRSDGSPFNTPTNGANMLISLPSGRVMRLE